MKARPSTGRSSASAKSAGRIGADGCPPKVLLQSSKSSACAAVPLISAASSALVRSAEPNTRLAGRGRNDQAENSRGRLDAARDRDADGIEDADLGPTHRWRRQILEPQRRGPAGKLVCELHVAPAAPASRAKTVPAMRRSPPGSLK